MRKSFNDMVAAHVSTP